MYGDMITKAEIQATPCPYHGGYCYPDGAFCACGDPINAIYLKHMRKVAANRCDSCRRGDTHVHLGS